MNSVGLSKFKGPRSRELLLSMNPPLSGHPAVREINAFANFQIPPAYANRIKVDACQKCQMNCARLAHQQFRSRWLRTRVFWTRVSREQNKQRRYDFAESSSDVFSIYRYFALDHDYFVLPSRTVPKTRSDAWVAYLTRVRFSDD